MMHFFTEMAWMKLSNGDVTLQLSMKDKEVTTAESRRESNNSNTIVANGQPHHEKVGPRLL